MILIKRVFIFLGCVCFSAVFARQTVSWRKPAGKAVAAVGGLGLAATVIKLIMLEKQRAGASSKEEIKAIENRITKWRRWLGASLAAAGIGATTALWPSNDGQKTDEKREKPQIQAEGTITEGGEPAAQALPRAVAASALGAVPLVPPTSSSSGEKNESESGGATSASNDIELPEPLLVNINSSFAAGDIESAMIDDLIKVHSVAKINLKGCTGLRIDKPYQDAFVVRKISPSVYQFLLADGSGLNPIYLTLEACDLIEKSPHIESGGHTAQFILNFLSTSGTDLSRDDFVSAHRALQNEIKKFEITHAMLEDINSGDYTTEGVNKFKSAATSCLIGGQAAVISVVLNLNQHTMRVVNCGDCVGAVFDRAGNMRLTKHKHKTLSGHLRLETDYALGGFGADAEIDGDEDKKLDSITDEVLNLGSDTDFIVIGCDGFWDSVTTADDLSPDEKITVRGIFDCVHRALNEKSNPSKVLADLARTKGSEDDITVLVVDLRAAKTVESAR